MKDDCCGCVFDDIGSDVDIAVQREWLIFATTPGIGQLRTFDDV